MAFKSKLRRFNGSDLGRLAQPVHVCDRCGAWQVDHLNRPLATPGFYCINGQCAGSVFIRFMSKAEARAYGSMLLRVASGELRTLELQPRFKLHAPTPAGSRALIWTYVADFSAVIAATGERVIFEVKSSADTQISEVKRKHCEAEYGFKIRMVTA